MHLGVPMQAKSRRRNHQVQGQNLLERRSDDRRLRDTRTGSPMEHHSFLHHLLDSPGMDNQISRLGQRISSSTTQQANIHEHSKRFCEQVWQGRMLEGSAIALRIKVRTKNLVSASAQGVTQTWISRMSVRQVPVSSTRHAHHLVCR